MHLRTKIDNFSKSKARLINKKGMKASQKNSQSTQDRAANNQGIPRAGKVRSGFGMFFTQANGDEPRPNYQRKNQQVQ